jgi:hypothetical protein
MRSGKDWKLKFRIKFRIYIRMLNWEFILFTTASGLAVGTGFHVQRVRVGDGLETR